MHKPSLKMTRQTHSFSRICESLREREREKERERRIGNGDTSSGNCYFKSRPSVMSYCHDLCEQRDASTEQTVVWKTWYLWGLWVCSLGLLLTQFKVYFVEEP